ncbi:MAG: tryptophan-rich sensory protein [Patescibacteria group bacterium]|nr:tryptophan-rich sensory protein [Patescibacteria group bacterium]
MKTNYAVIPFIALLLALVKSLITDQGTLWYESVLLPARTPSGLFLWIASSLAFIAFVLSAVLTWNNFKGERRTILMFVFGACGALDIAGLYLFFISHYLAAALGVKLILLAAVLALSAVILRFNRPASYLLLFYGAWVALSGYLAYLILVLNAQ